MLDREGTTAVLTRPEPPAGRTTRTPRGLSFAPALVTAAVVLTVLVANDTPPTAIARYGGYLLYGVLVPGTLVHRALRGRSPLLFADLALGAATGLMLELVAWACCVGAGVPSLLRLWPLLVIVPFALVPRLWRHWRLTDPAGVRCRPAVGWGLAAVTCWYAVARAGRTFASEALPPRPSHYYEDLYWHLANAAELSRSLPPQVPSVADRTLLYHWFSSAHVAASHLVSGVDLPTAMFRFWELPVFVILLGLLVALLHEVSGRAWPAVVSGALMTLPQGFSPWRWYRPGGADPLTHGSPSQLFGVVFLLLASVLLVRVVRGREIGAGGWVVLVLAVAVAPGSKPAVLPVLMAGVGCCLLAGLLRRRAIRAPWFALVLMAASVLAFSSLAQTSAGSKLKLLGVLAFQPPWSHTATRQEPAGTGGSVLPGLDDAGAVLLAAMLVIAMLLQWGSALAGLVLLRRGTRGDPALLFLAAGFLAGLAALLVVDHPGQSELYFARTSGVLGMVLAGWGVAEAVGRMTAGRRTVAAVLAVATGTGIGVFLLARRAGQLAPDSYLRRGKLRFQPEQVPWALAVPLLVVAGTVLVVSVLAWWLIRRRPGAGLGAAFAAVAIVAGCLAGPVLDASLSMARQYRPGQAQGTRVTADEVRAARWMAMNVPQRDLVATNVHCKGTVPGRLCDARAFWVAGLTERRMLVESWAYTEETFSRIGTIDGGFPHFPFDDPARLTSNDLVFRAPSPAALALLRDRYGVRWLFADRRAGPVSALLPRYADLRLRTTDVDVYQLRTR